MAIKIQAAFDRVSTRKDGSLGLTFSTQELPVVDKVTIMDFVGGYGWLLFSQSEKEVVKVPPAPARDGRTPSQRLRGVIYRLWERTNAGDFETFYRRSMERAINQVKEILRAGDQ